MLNNYLGNPQITKTCLNIYNVLVPLVKDFIAFRLRPKAVKNKLFIMLVGISETTRLLFTNIIILFKSSTFLTFILIISGRCTFALFLCLRTCFSAWYTLNYSKFSNSNMMQTIFDSNIKTSSTENKNKESDKHFYEWLAGLIDGDGYF